MTKVTIQGDFTEMYDTEVKNNKATTYIPASKKNIGKKVKVLIYEANK